MNVLKPILLTTIGSIEIYYYGMLKDGRATDVYWQCLKAQKGYGPFQDIEKALAHLTMYGHHLVYNLNHYALVQFHSDLPPNVIKADFKAKRRLSPSIRD